MKPFPGFNYPEKNFYQFPKDLNGYYGQLSGNEFKVLAYIIRKTWGFNKIEDKISYNQFLKGVVKKDGIKVFDKLGIAKATLRKTLKDLEKKGFIKIIKQKGKTNRYQLNYLKNYTSTSSKTELVTSSEIEPTIEDSTIDNKQYNTVVASQSDANHFQGKEINELIKKFEKVNPSYERLFSNKTQRSALERLLKKMGHQKLEQIIDILPAILGESYAPRITTPFKLEEKLADLLIFLKQRSEKDSQMFTIKKPKKENENSN